MLYIPGVGNVPKEREDVPRLWAPLGLKVEFQRIDWTKSNYHMRLQEIGQRAVHLAQQGKRVSVVGESGGGKVALSLLARHADVLHRVVTISSKVDPYILSAASQEQLPNLVISSDVFAADLPALHGELLPRILCVHPPTDEVVAPADAVLPGAEGLIVGGQDHVSGIVEAITSGKEYIANHIRQD